MGLGKLGRGKAVPLQYDATPAQLVCLDVFHSQSYRCTDARQAVTLAEYDIPAYDSQMD